MFTQIFHFSQNQSLSSQSLPSQLNVSNRKLYFMLSAVPVPKSNNIKMSLLDVTLQYTYWFISSSKYLLRTTPSCFCNCIFPLGLKLSIFLVFLISVAIQRLQNRYQCLVTNFLLNSLK